MWYLYFYDNQTIIIIADDINLNVTNRTDLRFISHDVSS